MGSETLAHRFYVMDIEALDFVLWTDFFVQHFQIQFLTLQAPYLLYMDHGSGRESVPLEQLEHTSSYLRVSKEEPSNMMAASKTGGYQLLGKVLDQGLKEFGYSREDLSVELFASDKQHVLDLYCSKGKNCSLGMQVPIRTNLLEFEFAPNSLDFVDPPEFEFEIKNFKFLYRIHFPVPTSRLRLLFRTKE